MNQTAVLNELLAGDSACFSASLQTLANGKLFQPSNAKDEITFALGIFLLSRYLHWRTENGVTIDFEGDIQLLLKSESVREQLTTNLFTRGEATIRQLETVLDLLILASYSRHITVNQTVKRGTGALPPRPRDFPRHRLGSKCARLRASFGDMNSKSTIEWTAGNSGLDS